MPTRRIVAIALALGQLYAKAGNPDPDATVFWGLQSWNEMAIGWVLFTESSVFSIPVWQTA